MDSGLCMLSCFSHIWLSVTLWTVAHQASLSVGFLQARILEWVAMPSSRRSSRPRNWSCVSCLLHWQACSLPLAPPRKPMDWGILTNIQCWNPIPNVMVFGYGGFGGEVIIAGPLWEDTQENLLPLSLFHVRTQREDSHLTAQKRVFREPSKTIF